MRGQLLHLTHQILQLKDPWLLGSIYFVNGSISAGGKNVCKSNTFCVKLDVYQMCKKKKQIESPMQFNFQTLKNKDLITIRSMINLSNLI